MNEVIFPIAKLRSNLPSPVVKNYQKKTFFLSFSSKSLFFCLSLYHRGAHSAPFNQKPAIMKNRRALRTLTLLLVLFTTASSWAEDYYVAEYAAATHTLTFKKSTTAPNNTTSWDASNTGDYEPGWHGLGTNITTVVFEESFKAARPTSCCIWFFYFSNLTTVTDMEKYLNTSSVTNMAGMFSGCSSLTSLDVSNWVTGSVTNMGGMFSGCSSLASLDVSNWATSSVTGMGGMFFGCSSLTSLDVSKWDTSSVEFMDEMFSGCSSLTSPL